LHATDGVIQAGPRNDLGTASEAPSERDQQRNASKEFRVALARLSEEEKRVAVLKDEVRSARQALASERNQQGQRIVGSGDGLRASDEALQEAERAQLQAQRAVLEAELVERRAAYERTGAEVRQAQAAAARDGECN